MKNEKKVILDFALEQLKSAITDLKSGKIPEGSKNLKRAIQVLNAANKQLQDKKITEEEMENIAKDISKKIEGK